jgi:ADP-heptose:LPS heptosyltransferase
MRALKYANPERRLTLLCSGAGAQVAPFIPEVDDVLVCDAAWVKNQAQGNAGDRQLLAALDHAAFDGAVIFTVYSQCALPAALMCHLAAIPRVLAYSRENPYRLLTHWVKETEPGAGVRHEVRRQLDLVATIAPEPSDLRLSFALRPIDRVQLNQRLTAMGLTGEGPWIVVHCGATAASRRYPGEQFAQAIELMRGAGRKIFLTGGNAERALVADVARHCALGPDLINLAGELSLGELGALIAAASVVVCSNSGPAHMAAALGTPVVDLYALTNPQHTPWQVPHRLLYHDVPCKYCYRSICPQGHHACLAKVPPQAVASAAMELLSARAEVALCRPPKVA